MYTRVKKYKNKMFEKKSIREKIPTAVRTAVWNTYIGADKAKGQCLVGCGNEITIPNFECGHVKSVKNGGDTTITNLRPICSQCNRSMGAMHMDDFIKKYQFKKPTYFNQPEVNNTVYYPKRLQNAQSIPRQPQNTNYIYPPKKVDISSEEIQKIKEELAQIERLFMFGNLSNTSLQNHIIRQQELRRRLDDINKV